MQHNGLPEMIFKHGNTEISSMRELLKAGCSGFLYKDWRGAFYPQDLDRVSWFKYYQSFFDTVELSITFHRLLKKETFFRWYKETPDNFSMCLKGSRFITHIKKLKDVELPLDTFFNSASTLQHKLKVVLWQLPPHIKYNYKSFELFVQLLTAYKVRHAFEFRHESWITEKVVKLLHSENMAFCMADCPEHLIDLPVTADFVYMRRHGKTCSYDTLYTEEEITEDFNRIKSYIEQNKTVYIFFNNDAQGFAPKNAVQLIDMFKDKYFDREPLQL